MGSALAIYENGTQLEVPIYGASRLGMYNKASGTSVYQLTDHLGNVRAVIAKNGSEAVAATSTTDYYPFGMPMPNRQIINGQPYRYAYQGQEKDSETGKEAFQLRLWDARIGRWLTTDPYSQYHSPYNGMGNDPVNGVDPDGGYRTWFHAALRWVASGFKGKIHRAGLGGNKEWSIRKVEYNLNYIPSGGGVLFSITSDYGNDVPLLMTTVGESLMYSGARIQDLPKPYVDIYAKGNIGAQIGLKTPFGKVEAGALTTEIGKVGFSSVDGFYARQGDGTSHNFAGAKVKFFNEKLAAGVGIDYVTPTSPPEGADLLEFFSNEHNKTHWSLYAGPGKSIGPGLPYGIDGGKLSGKYEANGKYIKFNGGVKFIFGIDIGAKIGFK